MCKYVANNLYLAADYTFLRINVPLNYSNIISLIYRYSVTTYRNSFTHAQMDSLEPRGMLNFLKIPFYSNLQVSPS